MAEGITDYLNSRNDCKGIPRCRALMKPCPEGGLCLLSAIQWGGILPAADIRPYFQVRSADKVELPDEKIQPYVSSHSLSGVSKTAGNGTGRLRWRRHGGKHIGGDVANEFYQLAAFAGFWPAQRQGRDRLGILE